MPLRGPWGSLGGVVGCTKGAGLLAHQTPRAWPGHQGCSAHALSSTSHAAALLFCLQDHHRWGFSTPELGSLLGSFASWCSAGNLHDFLKLVSCFIPYKYCNYAIRELVLHTKSLEKYKIKVSALSCRLLSRILALPRARGLGGGAVLGFGAAPGAPSLGKAQPGSTACSTGAAPKLSPGFWKQPCAALGCWLLPSRS